jgi:hypothetical protein
MDYNNTLDTIESCLEKGIYLSKWENDFLLDLQSRFESKPNSELTIDQDDKLGEIYSKVYGG